jgi:transcriptional regulator with XRE-family HTH domain
MELDKLQKEQMFKKYKEMANDDVIKEMLWAEYEKQLNKDYDLELETNMAYPELIKHILKKNGFTVEQACELAGISTSKYHKIRSGEQSSRKADKKQGEMITYTPHWRDLIAICIVCDIDMERVKQILNSLGLCFKKSDKNHYAYIYILNKYRGKSLEECNELLKFLNVDKEYLFIQE